MNIYVGNLAYSVTDAGLRSVFEPYGEVISAEVIVDRRTRRSRGYGFVRMANAEQGRSAIEALNGKDFEGRPLRIDESRPDAEKRGTDPGSRRGPHPRRPAPATAPGAVVAAPPARTPGLFGFLKAIFSRS